MAYAGGWYSRSDIATFYSGRTGGTSWHGKIVGVGEYDQNPNNHPIVLKIETGRGSDWFVGLNRAAGPNSHAVQFQDIVTLYKVKSGNGRRYSHSFLKASLKEAQRETWMVILKGPLRGRWWESLKGEGWVEGMVHMRRLSAIL